MTRDGPASRAATRARPAGKRTPATGTGASVTPAAPVPPGLELVAAIELIERTVDAWLPLSVGDRALVAAGESVVAGAVIAERLREARLVDVDAPDLHPGDRWMGVGPVAGKDGRRAAGPSRGLGVPGLPGVGSLPGVAGIGGARAQLQEARGEVLFERDRRWLVAAGENVEPLESPLDAIVREVRPGLGIGLRATGVGLRGTFALGGVARGRLSVATAADGELGPRDLDVGSAGAILVAGARIDAESLIRARAMGIRGVIVATLASKERRDFLASEARQRAAIHRLPQLAVLVLHGTVRRAIAAPQMSLLRALDGRAVAIVADPPRLVFDPDDTDLPSEPHGRVHVRSGPLAGHVGEWAGPAGLWRFSGGTHLEAGFVRFAADEPPVALPLGDLERYV